jgi:predicted esterase
VTVPVLIIHGVDDDVIPEANSKVINRIYLNVCHGIHSKPRN